MKHTTFLLSLLVTVAASPSIGEAQTVTRATPAVASPGFVTMLEGSSLSLETQVLFHLSVGGFVGNWTEPGEVLSVFDGGILVLVPLSTVSFVPPGIQGSTPIGMLTVQNPSPSVPAVTPFYFLEGTGGFLANTGLGTTNPNGPGRPSISFDPARTGPEAGTAIDPKALGPGAPVPGNLDFAMRLENATPGAQPFLVIGAPGPALPFRGGVIAVDLRNVFTIRAGPPVDASGVSALPLSIPARLAGGPAATAQWFFRDPASGQLMLSNALQLEFGLF